MTSKLRDYLFYVSAVLLLLSAALYVTGWTFIPYVYAIASSGVAVYNLTTHYTGDNLRLKRLRFMEIVAAIMLPISSFFMFKGKNEWFLLLFISAILQLYCVFVKDRELKKKDETE